MRLTKDVIQKLLNMNEGFTKTTSSSHRNFKADYHYLIKGGRLFIQEMGKTSWADSSYVSNMVADIDQTRRFLKKFIDSLNTDGLE